MKNRMATSSFKKSERETAHTKISTEIAEQGIVLLENKGCLPFDDTVKSIALFGSGARNTVKGGTGSGDVNVREFVTVEQGLRNAGYEIVSTQWLNEYSSVIHNARAIYDENIRETSRKGAFIGLVAMMSNPFQCPTFRSLTESELMQYPADAAIYTLARNSGEGSDRKAEEGDYYLTEQEISDITLLSGLYHKFILLLNTGGVVDLTSIKNIPGINAIVLISQGGSGCGNATAAVLSGKVTPSGKLTATWAKNYQDYPFSKEYAAGDGDIFDTYYKEGIYVGYRYFDTFDIVPAYEFGFGRSYTEFSIKVCSVTLEANMLTLDAIVKNTGDRYSGREVVQLYIEEPDGKLEKPHQVLCAFQKTREILPGEQQKVILTFPLERLASYDESQASWILESGDYTLYCGNSSRNTKAVAIITVTETVLTEQCKNLFRKENIDELKKKHTNCVSKCADIVQLTAHLGNVSSIAHKYCTPSSFHTYKANITFEDVKNGKASAEELATVFSIEELATMCVGAARFNLADVTLVGNSSEEIPGAAGETTGLLKKYGIPSITMVDGPAGIRVNPIVHEKNGMYIKNPEEDPIFKYVLSGEQAKVDLSGTVTKYQYCTALPISTMLAQTWDLGLLERAGQIVGEEMKELGVALWLAPGMNIQRNPLCGRNFEYYSEDPLLSGLCAAAVTRGVQSITGKGATIKHLAANNQETNRNFNNSHVSERTLREIYLKGFEICVKEARPLAVMTSVNLINGIHTANDHDLLTGVLRDEWGFDGIVMTDWGVTGAPGKNKEQKYGNATAVACISSGNDLIMPGTQQDVDYITAAVETGELKLEALRRCVVNIIKLLLKTENDSEGKYYNNRGDK